MAKLPVEIEEKSYTVLDTSEEAIMLHVNHGHVSPFAFSSRCLLSPYDELASRGGILVSSSCGYYRSRCHLLAALRSVKGKTRSPGDTAVVYRGCLS